MDLLEKPEAIERIKNLMARYFRLMDTKSNGINGKICSFPISSPTSLIMRRG